MPVGEANAHFVTHTLLSLDWPKLSANQRRPGGRQRMAGGGVQGCVVM